MQTAHAKSEPGKEQCQRYNIGKNGKERCSSSQTSKETEYETDNKIEQGEKPVLGTRCAAVEIAIVFDDGALYGFAEGYLSLIHFG